MKQLIVTGDDFGRSHEVNEAVERDHRAGLTTQASLMVNEDAVAEAVRIARRNPRLAVGLHVTLCAGKASRVSTLSDAAKNFAPSPARAGIRYAFDPRLRGELAREIEAQFARFRDLGIAPTYFDGHTHLHLHPAILALALPVARDHGFHAMRLVREPGAITPVPLIFQLLSRAALPKLRALGMRFADRTFGLSRTGKMDTRYFEDVVRGLADGVTEIYYHPGAEIFEIDAAHVAALAAESGAHLTNFAVMQRGASVSTARPE
jgi:hopanoid biosynthesis associated protein HpnK